MTAINVSDSFPAFYTVPKVRWLWINNGPVWGGLFIDLPESQMGQRFKVTNEKTGELDYRVCHKEQDHVGHSVGLFFDDETFRKQEVRVERVIEVKIA